ncbi:MAG: PfkB family carbohydrate kinase [Clostridia bacterium]|nr:PfkB family carbohydrate kinase [Clostridia bacterium]
MIDVTAIGEILIDFTPSGFSEQGNLCFERNPGGAPANVLACISKLGGKTAFIGKVGNDLFGHYLSGVLNQYDICTQGLRFSDTAGTTLAFVELDQSGDRSFSFYRNPGADTMLSKDEVDYDLIENSKVFHCGSLSLTDEPSKTATISALNYAKSCGCTISCDPNLRLRLWRSEDIARETIKSLIGYADILKISLEELEFITGYKNLTEGLKVLKKDFEIPLILVTLGAEGCCYHFKGTTAKKPGFKSVNTLDTTGAGDAFLGGFLYGMLERGIVKPKELEMEVLEEIVHFSNAVAALCTTKRGAIPAMPDLDLVKRLIKG